MSLPLPWTTRESDTHTSASNDKALDPQVAAAKLTSMGSDESQEKFPVHHGWG